MEDLKKAFCEALQLTPGELVSWHITKRSLDARRKGQVYYLYSVAVETADDAKILKRSLVRRGKDHLSGSGSRIRTAGPGPSRLRGGIMAEPAREQVYHFPEPGSEEMRSRPVIVGSGPAGLFAAWMLAKHGYRPVVLEMGDPASERLKKIESYWETGVLDPDSNVQFGEGGAGTFSDGKLNTGVHDAAGRNYEVLRIFAAAGAPENILYDARPHVGTDVLIHVVQEMRRQICEAGGEVRFRTKVTDILIENAALSPRVAGIRTEDGTVIETGQVILAIGHSSRQTFRMLAEKPLIMEPKAFAVGVRIEHPQEMINRQQYGNQASQISEPASYRLAVQLPSGRRVYTFCMCPGGYVVNASSEPGYLAVNGMSYHARDSRHANSAVIVSVTPEDFAPYAKAGIPEVLNGMLFQYELEKCAFMAGNGAAPVQRFEDFRNHTPGTGSAGALVPCHKGKWQYADVRSVFPFVIGDSLEEGILAFDRKIPGFAMPDALLTGVESRTSSPVRIVRDPHTLESPVAGLYPCGEGAGYAGGITSAAMDGLKAAEMIGSRYRPFAGSGMCQTKKMYT